MYNYHMHTKRCGHAKGEDEEYVLRAITNGYDKIGFSDHAPYVFPNEYESNFRVKLDMAHDYADSVHALKEKYKGIIDIKLGYELEYYPHLHDMEMEYLAQFNYDYLILGQHFTDNEYEEYARYSGHETNNVAQLDKYVSQVITGAKTGDFAYIAHPDVIFFTGEHTLYLKKMKYMVEELKKLDLPLEFNFLGYTTNRHYPNRDFWEIVAKTGNRVVIGLDAHKPEVFDDNENLEKAHEYLAELGIKPEDNFVI